MNLRNVRPVTMSVQQNILLTAALAAAVIGMFPPYNVRTECIFGQHLPQRQQEYPFGNFFFLLNVTPPKLADLSSGCAVSVQIDPQRLYARWATVFFVFGLLLLAFRKKEEPEDDEVTEQLFEIRRLLALLVNNKQAT